VVKLVHPDGLAERETKGLDPGEYNTLIAQGFMTKEQLKAEQDADKARLAALKEADSADPAKAQG
jgi:hypothetical protein